MPKWALFERLWHHYDQWFDEHQRIYETELQALQRLLPPFQKALEVGVGTGRFSAPLGIELGLEPSQAMAKIARQRGIEVIEGVAEKLPFEDESFDLVLMVTTVCFVDDTQQALKEAYRVLKKGGYLIVGFIDKNSPLGRFYQANKDKSRFYKEARFFSKEEIIELLKKTGFSIETCNEALFGDTLSSLSYEIYDGCTQKGAFIGIRAKK